MAKERRSLSGKVVAITGGARGIGKATATALVRKGCRVAIGDLDLALAEQTAAALGGGTSRCRSTSPTAPPSPPSSTRPSASSARSTSLINNAGIMPVTPLVEESDDSIQPPARHQPPRRHHRHPAGDRADAARAAAATSSTSPPRPARPACPASPPTRRPSTPSSASARRCGRSCAAAASRSLCVMPTVVNTELTERRRPALGQTGRGRGRRQRDRRRARGAALRRLRAARQRRPSTRSLGPCCRASCREALGRLMKVDKLMTEVDHGARRAYEERAAASEPGAEEYAAAERDGRARRRQRDAA